MALLRHAHERISFFNHVPMHEMHQLFRDCMDGVFLSLSLPLCLLGQMENGPRPSQYNFLSLVTGPRSSLEERIRGLSLLFSIFIYWRAEICFLFYLRS
jgi:hypothetical protein